MQPAAFALLTMGVSSLASGGLMLWRRAAVVSALLLVSSGATCLLSAGLLATDRGAAGRVAATAAISLLLALAAATYPTVHWRHPVDFSVLVVLGACGLVGTLWQEAAEVEGLVASTAGFAYLWWRIETSSGRERRAVTWLAAALAGTSLVFAFAFFGSADHFDPLGFAAVFALIGPAMYLGATLPDLVDVRSLVVSGVVFGVAVVAYISLFALALALLDATGADQLSVGTTALLGALVAVSFAPTQSVMRGVVEQLLFGVRLDPLSAASAVAGTLGDDPVQALRAIRESLNLPYAVLLVDGAAVATSGTAPTDTRTFDLGDNGSLVVGLRSGDQRLTAADEQVLGLTAPLLAQTLRARALAAEVVESRGRTIAAIEEERRRLRRDLHDGLGPRLSGVAFTSDAARNLIRTDPAAAEEMVAQLRADTVIAIEEIRAMVYAMRPPALDELGLVPALRQQAVGLRNRDGRPISVSVAADELPDLPAAVEVAAYRIVTEALANVARHSTSPTADVRIAATGEELRLEVTDAGTSDDWRPGVGMSSMRERATELGGTLEAGPGPTGGKVAALLPL